MEIIVDIQHVVLVHHILQIIVDIQLCSAIHDGVHLVQEFVELNAKSVGNILKVQFAVHLLYYAHFQLALACHGAHTQVQRAFYLIVLAMASYQFAELLAITLRLALPHSGDVLQFLERNGIHGCHGLHGTVLEYHVGRNAQYLRTLATQVAQLLQQRFVEHGSTFLGFGFVVAELRILLEVERFRRCHELLACLGKFEQTIVLHLLFYIARQYALFHKGMPIG